MHFHKKMIVACFVLLPFQQVWSQSSNIALIKEQRTYLLAAKELSNNGIVMQISSDISSQPPSCFDSVKATVKALVQGGYSFSVPGVDKYWFTVGYNTGGPVMFEQRNDQLTLKIPCGQTQAQIEKSIADYFEPLSQTTDEEWNAITEKTLRSIMNRRTINTPKIQTELP